MIESQFRNVGAPTILECGGLLAVLAVSLEGSFEGPSLLPLQLCLPRDQLGGHVHTGKAGASSRTPRHGLVRELPCLLIQFPEIILSARRQFWSAAPWRRFRNATPQLQTILWALDLKPQKRQQVPAAHGEAFHSGNVGAPTILLPLPPLARALHPRTPLCAPTLCSRYAAAVRHARVRTRAISAARSVVEITPRASIRLNRCEHFRQWS